MESNPQTGCAPARPPAPYFGGKARLAKRLVTMIEAVPHRLYAEPFVGMGGVFFRRARRPQMEVINDWSADVATLFRVVQRHYPAFVEELRWRLSSRAEFDRLVATDPVGLTDLERAARFLYIQKLAFSGKIVNRAFGIDNRRSRFDVTRIAPLLADIHRRLAGVTIERLPFDRFIAAYDGPETLFFVDPPYWGCEREYQRLFGRDDFGRLADQLGGIRGRFILTINDRPETRAVFAAFRIEPVEINYSVRPARTLGRELIVTNG